MGRIQNNYITTPTKKEYEGTKAPGKEAPGESRTEIKAVQGVEQPKSETIYNEKEVIEAIEHANNAFQVVNTRFEFSIHEGTKEIMVKIINTENDEVIREIPPEKILDIMAKIWELAGIFVDERA
ncbi:MAG: flagellar protein FlaG [Clostridia bacterium]|nr:flagellar protein FlaG [Clostridia bacterium]